MSSHRRGPRSESKGKLLININYNIFFIVACFSEFSSDSYLPLLDHGPELVSGHVHSVEVSENVFSLDFLRDELELPEGHLIVLEISQGGLEHTTLQTLRSNLYK